MFKKPTSHMIRHKLLKISAPIPADVPAFCSKKLTNFYTEAKLRFANSQRKKTQKRTWIPTQSLPRMLLHSAQIPSTTPLKKNRWEMVESAFDPANPITTHRNNFIETRK